MLRTILLSAGILASVPVFAAPNQIDVIGLIPDVSTSVEVEEAKKGEHGTFVIGGATVTLLSRLHRRKTLTVFLPS